MNLKNLSQLHYLNREVEQNSARLEELYSKAIGTGQRITGMPRVSGITDNMARYAVEIADLKSIIEENVQQCLDELTKLYRYINAVDDVQMRLILSLRFIDGLTWQQVANRIGGNNTEDTVRRSCYRFLAKSENLSQMSQADVLL